MDARRWHSSYLPGMPKEINLDENQTLVTLINRSFGAFADQPAATCLGETVSYADLDRLSRALVGYLLAAGLKKGDRVALMLPSSIPFLIGLAGILRAGMIVVTVNPLYTARELELQLADSGAKVVIAIEGLLSSLLGVAARTDVRQVLVAPLSGWKAFSAELGEGARPLGPGDASDTLQFDLAPALRIGWRAPRADAKTSAGNPAFLQYTGGTTGISKGAILTHKSFGSSLAQTMSWMPAKWSNAGISIVTPLPLYHVYPLAVAFISFALGAHNRLIPNPRDINTVIAEMKRAPFQFFIGVNTLFNALVNSPELANIDFSATDLVTGAGASVQAAVAERWAAAGAPPITEAYGLSETSPSATFNPPGRSGTIGIPVPSTDARIVDEEGNDVLLGQAGELLLRGPQLFAGYWQRPDETQKALTSDGWFKTGDVVTMDEAGFMYMVDRKKDMILVSGFNVYPNEIEGVVAMMPAVLECACVGVPDERSGEVPHLYVVPKSPELTPKDIEAHCRNNLAPYKVPRHITLVESLPKSTVGKILRRELRAITAPITK